MQLRDCITIIKDFLVLSHMIVCCRFLVKPVLPKDMGYYFTNSQSDWSPKN